jgi:hypothetical protein
MCDPREIRVENQDIAFVILIDEEPNGPIQSRGRIGGQEERSKRGIAKDNTSFLSRLIVSGMEYALFTRTIPSSSAARIATGEINTNANSAADRMLRVSMGCLLFGPRHP